MENLNEPKIDTDEKNSTYSEINDDSLKNTNPEATRDISAIGKQCQLCS